MRFARHRLRRQRAIDPMSALECNTIFGALVLVGSFVGMEAPLAQENPTTERAWTDAQLAYLTWNSLQPGWSTTASGLQYRRDSAGHPDQPSPQASCAVTVAYEGRLINGQLFDSSTAHNNPITFQLNRLIRGWREGLMLMHQGETFSFAIPPNLGYASRWYVSHQPDLVSIPAGSALLFKVTLLGLPACHAQ